MDPRLREDDGGSSFPPHRRLPRPSFVIPGYDRESICQIGLQPPSLLGFQLFI